MTPEDADRIVEAIVSLQQSVYFVGGSIWGLILLAWLWPERK